MLLVVLGLLILFAALAVIGFLVKTLLWLAVIGCGFFLATAIAGVGTYLDNRRK